jgi:hypothetical protein
VKGYDAVRPAGCAGPRPVGCVSRGKKRREAGCDISGSWEQDTLDLL